MVDLVNIYRNVIPIKIQISLIIVDNNQQNYYKIKIKYESF